MYEEWLCTHVRVRKHVVNRHSFDYEGKRDPVFIEEVLPQSFHNR